MRSLTSKLTLAFLVVGVIGVLLAGVLISVRSQQAFDKFLFGRSRPATEAALRTYYAIHGSWDGLDRAVLRAPSNLTPSGGPPLITIADVNGVVVYGGGGPDRLGRRVPNRILMESVPINVDGEVVGYLVFDFFGDRRLPDAPERLFLANVNRSIVLASAGAAIVALILGAILARTLTKPIRELTHATQRIAGGDLGVQVPVYTRDELGELAASFNSMSEDLALASYQRKQMTADIAHDLRTPLSVILGYTEALSDGKLAATQDITETLHREAQQLNHLIEDLRTLSLADAGELPLHRSIVPPQLLLERAASTHAMQAEQSGVTLHIVAEDNLPKLTVDTQRMAQVLSNMVSNALHHTPSGGAITLSARATTDGVLLSVGDTGDGIAPEDLPHVFSRFYRSDRARTDAGASGLGLSIAKSIVEAHGGTISVTSVPGDGAVFTIRLPVASSDGAE